MMAPPEHVSMRYVRPGLIEGRAYQEALAKEAVGQNCIIVLPTGLGKTVVALRVIAEYIDRTGKAVLFLAPTRVLVSQHHKFLTESMTISDIAIITGEDPIKKRKKRWESNSIICATPEIVRNDLERNIATAEQFGLVIFDEVHRTIGDYAYSAIASRLPATSRIMGMTATLPSEQIKAKEIMERLRILKVEHRTEKSPDVAPYIQETKTEWVRVDLPPEMQRIQSLVKRALDKRYDALSRAGVNVDSKSLSGLLRARPYVMYQKRAGAKPLFSAIRITYALNILEAHGIMPFIKFCERTQKKKGAGIKELFEDDPDFVPAIARAKEAAARGIEHSKLDRLSEIVAKQPGKVLIFSSYRDSVSMIQERLIKDGISCGVLIGKAGTDGLKQKKQLEAVQMYRDGQYRALAATRVGEEGLDISEVNLVVFYDNVPSSIRYVQRRGRTGRKDAGRLVVLIARKTIDEAYYWIGQKKIAKAGSMSGKMARHVQEAAEPEGLDRFIPSRSSL